MKRVVVTKRKFLAGFIVVTLVLSLVKCIFPSVAVKDGGGVIAAMDSVAEMPVDEEPLMTETVGDSMAEKMIAEVTDTVKGHGRFFDGKHPIYSVSSFKEEFPDTNALQLTAAEKYGVKPVANRVDAEHRKSELVYIGSNPYYEVLCDLRNQKRCYIKHEVKQSCFHITVR